MVPSRRHVISPSIMDIKHINKQQMLQIEQPVNYNRDGKMKDNVYGDYFILEARPDSGDFSLSSKRKGTGTQTPCFLSSPASESQQIV
jgi:hypothetical protein